MSKPPKTPAIPAEPPCGDLLEEVRAARMLLGEILQVLRCTSRHMGRQTDPRTGLCAAGTCWCR